MQQPVIAILGTVLQSDAGEFSLRDIAQRAYGLAVSAAGGVPIVVPCLEDEYLLEGVLERCDGLLITGGADVSPDEYGAAPLAQLGSVDPLRDRMDQVAVRYALAHPELPVLGICRGIQSLAVYAGGTLIQDIPSQVPKALQHSQKAPGWHGIHEVTLEPDSLLARATGRPRAMVNSFHHQAVADLPDGFVATAHTADGVIEAMERREGAFCLGLQFHPELMAPRHHFIAAIFGRFVDAAKEKRPA
ncbi:MAG: gamma-glutamyl-gamma-aminobutyrate hydrolase family protein [Armatimonadota bacterium]